MLIDSHCHLDFPDFAGEVPALLDRARAAGVDGLITICTHASKFAQVAAIADTYAARNVWCSLGIHPHHAAEPDEQVSADDLLALAKHPRVVAIGECGLDYYYDHSPREIQQRCFEMQIEVAKQLDLPVVIHSREADDDTIRLLQAAGPKLRGVMHCFSGTRRLCEAALEIGFYISMSGILTFNKSQDLRDIAKDVPLDRLLVETDAPYLAPVPMRGKRNEPSFVAHTAAKLAELKGVSADEIGRITTESFHRLFNRAVAS